MPTGHVLWALAALDGLPVKNNNNNNNKNQDKAKLVSVLKLDYIKKQTPELGFTDDEKFSTKKSNINLRLLALTGA